MLKMNKVKVSTGLASLALVASIFAGLGTTLTVVALLLLFCEVENIKGVIVRVVSFLIGIELFMLVWSLIYGGYDLVCDTINGLIALINSYIDDPTKAISIAKLNNFLLTPIGIILKLANTYIAYFIKLIKFVFVVSFLEGKVAKENFISKFVNKFVDKAVAFVNGIEG